MEKPGLTVAPYRRKPYSFCRQRREADCICKTNVHLTVKITLKAKRCIYKNLAISLKGNEIFLLPQQWNVTNSNAATNNQQPARARSLPFNGKETALQHFRNTDSRKPSMLHKTEGGDKTLKPSYYSFQQRTVTVELKPLHAEKRNHTSWINWRRMAWTDTVKGSSFSNGGSEKANKRTSHI